MTKTSNILKYSGTALILIALLLFLWFMMRGSTKKTGGYPEDVVSDSLSCEATKLEYPFFSYNNVTSSSIKTNMVFNNESLDSIAMIVTLYYDNPDNAKSSEALNHSAMNQAMSREALKNSSINANYTYSDTYFRMSIYADGDQFGAAKKFFMIENASDKKIDIKKAYENQNFTCK